MNRILFFSDNADLITLWSSLLNKQYQIDTIIDISASFTADIIIIDADKIIQNKSLLSLFSNKTTRFLIMGDNWPEENQIEALVHGAAGYCNNYSNAYIVQRESNSGDMQWDNCYDNNGYEWINDIIPASDGGYYLLDKYFYLIKADENGNMVWSVELDYANQSLIELDNGTLILAGNESSIWLFPLDPSIID